MKTKYLILIFAILFLAFTCIWVLSPRVGEVVEKNEGQDIVFEDDLYNVPQNLPEGFVRYNAVSDAVVYKYVDEKDRVTYFEYIGNEQFTPYDINRPQYLVKTTFDKRIYQVKDAKGELLEQYRAFDGKTWQVVSKSYDIILEIPSNCHPLGTPNLFYTIDENENITYKLLSYIGNKYTWSTPIDGITEWLPIDVPSSFKKTEIYNVYYNEELKVYKKVIKFNDVDKTITAVTCDKDGKYIP